MDSAVFESKEKIAKFGCLFRDAQPVPGVRRVSHAAPRSGGSLIFFSLCRQPLSPRSSRPTLRALVLSGVREGDYERVREQVRQSDCGKVVLDGAGTLTQGHWCKLLRRVLQMPRLRELCIQNITVDREMTATIASFVTVSSLVDLSFDKCFLQVPSQMQQLAAGVARSSIRRFSFSKESFSKSECRAALGEFLHSFSLLNLSISGGFEKLDSEITTFLAQNHKAGLHLESPSATMIFSHRHWTAMPRGWLLRVGTAITSLDVSHNALSEVPPSFLALTALESLDLSTNQIREVPYLLRELTSLRVLNLADNPVAPKMVGDWKAVMNACAQSAAAETMLCSQGRVLVLGDRLVGKTTLCRNLSNKNKTAKKSFLLGRLRESSPPNVSGGGGGGSGGPLSPTSGAGGGSGGIEGLNQSGSIASIGPSNDGEEITIEVYDANAGEQETDSVTLKVWDFSPELLASPCFQFYLCNNTVFVIVFNLQSPTAIVDVEEWLSAVESRVSQPQVLLVGTHKDRTSNYANVASGVFDAFKRRKKSRVCACLPVDALRDCSEVRAKIKKAVLEMEGHLFLGHSFPRAYIRLASVLRAEAAQLTVPCISLERFQNIAKVMGIKSSAQAEEAAQFLDYLGGVLWYPEVSKVRHLVLLDPLWVVRSMTQLLSSERLRASGAGFLKTGLRKVLPPLHFPDESHAVFLSLFSAFEVVHELRSSNVWSAYVVPFLMSSIVSSFGEDQGFYDFVRSLGSVTTLNRTYKMSNLPRPLKTAILVAFLDVTQIHASIWAHGVVCAMQENDAKVTLMAQWKDGGLEELKLTIVSDSVAMATRYMHIFTTALEGVLANWYTPIAFIAYALGRNGVLHRVRKLIADFLNNRQVETLADVAPDLILCQAPEMHWKNLTKVRDLGAGSFGTVELYSTEQNCLVVVKKLLTTNEADEEQSVSSYLEFLRECWMMHFLQHPKVIRLVGVCMGPLAMILDFCSEKDLRMYLDTHENICWEVKLRILEDIVQGMNSAHQAFPVLVHRDVKSPNMFIHCSPESGIEARVADLGMATFLGRKCRSVAVDNPTWSAPEVIRGDVITEKADVFSLGIIMWELLTERFPYDDLMSEYGFASRLCDAITSWKVRPTITASDRALPDVPPGFVALLERCLAHESGLRPTCFEILHLVVEMQCLRAPIREYRGPVVMEQVGHICTADKVPTHICASGTLLYTFCISAMRFDVFSLLSGEFVRSYECKEAVLVAGTVTMVAMPNSSCWVVGQRWRNVLVLTGTEGMSAFGLKLIKHALTMVADGQDAWVFGLANQAKKNVVAVKVLGATFTEADGSQVYFNIGSIFKPRVSTDGKRVFAIVYDADVVHAPSAAMMAAAAAAAAAASGPVDGRKHSASWQHSAALAMTAYRKLSKNTTLTPEELAAMMSSNALDVVAATAAVKVDTVRAELCKLVSFDTATCTLVEHKLEWPSKNEEIADFVVVGTQVIVVHASGFLVFLDPFDTEKQLTHSAVLQTQGGLCQLEALFGGRFLLLWCGQELQCLPLWESDRWVSFAKLRVSQRLPNDKGKLQALTCLGDSSLFYAVCNDRKVLRFSVSPRVPPGVEAVRKADNKRSLTEVEENERQRKQSDMQKYVQKKGLMLNLSDVIYTESSKPMGLEFLMEGSLEDELRRSQNDKPAVVVVSSSPQPAHVPVSSPSNGGTNRKSIHSLFSPFKKDRRSSKAMDPTNSNNGPPELTRKGSKSDFNAASK